MFRLEVIEVNCVIIGCMTEVIKDESARANLDTYVYIDVSNIRAACLRSCSFAIDFVKFYGYLQNKYPGLKEARYYEGISADDRKKQGYFRFLEKSVGYKICSLARKSYVNPAEYDNFACDHCGAVNIVQILPETVKLKSNVDVYLASEMIDRAAKSEMPLNIILVSCDGDYAEAIKAVLRINPDSCVTVLATPMSKRNNCLSVRLKQLSKELPRDNYKLASINNIRDKISQA